MHNTHTAVLRDGRHDERGSKAWWHSAALMHCPNYALSLVFIHVGTRCISPSSRVSWLTSPRYRLASTSSINRARLWQATNFYPGILICPDAENALLAMQIRTQIYPHHKDVSNKAPCSGHEVLSRALKANARTTILLRIRYCFHLHIWIKPQRVQQELETGELKDLLAA